MHNIIDPIKRLMISQEVRGNLHIFLMPINDLTFRVPIASAFIILHVHSQSVECRPRLCFFIVISLDLSVDREDSLTS